MPTEIICSIVSVFGAVISAFISWIVSRSTANKEIKKLKLMWKREDVLTSDEDFSDMAATVARCTAAISDGYEFDISEVAAKVAAVRSRESGTLANLLDSLYGAVLIKNTCRMYEMLTKVIEEKRHQKSRQHRTGA